MAEGILIREVGGSGRSPVGPKQRTPSAPNHLVKRKRSVFSGAVGSALIGLAVLAVLVLLPLAPPGGEGSSQGSDPAIPTSNLVPVFLPRYLQTGTLSGDVFPFYTSGLRVDSEGNVVPRAQSDRSLFLPVVAVTMLAALGLCTLATWRVPRSRVLRVCRGLAVVIVGILVLSGTPAPVAAPGVPPTRLPGPADNFGIKPGHDDIAPLVEINDPAAGALVGPAMDVTVVFAAFKAGKASSFAFNGREVQGKNVGNVVAVRLYVFTSFNEKVASVALEWRNTPQAKQGEHTFEDVSLAPFPAGTTIIVCAVAYQGDPNGGIGRSTCRNLEVKERPQVECLFGPETFHRAKGQPLLETRSVTVTGRVEGPYTLYVFNGAPDGTHRVSSGTVRLNGEEVVSPNDLSQQVGAFEVDVTLEPGRNVLEVILQSAPGSFLALTLCGFLRAAPPTITILAPAAGSIIPTSTPVLRVDYAAGDEQPESALDLSTLRVLLDEADVTALLTVAGNTAFGTVDEAHALAEAPHVLEASIATVTGVYAEATSPFTVDLPPTVEVTAEPREVPVDQLVFLTVEAHDNLGLIGLHVTVNDERVQLDVTVNEGNVRRDVVGHAIFLARAPGPYVPEAIAMDTSGNTATDRDAFTALPTTPTELRVSVAADPSIAAVGQPVTLSVAVTSTLAVTSLSLSVEGLSVPLNRQNVGTFVPDREGLFVATAVAQDVEFHIATASTSFRAVGEDGILPTVVVTAVPPIQRVNDPVLITVKAADNVNVAELGLTVEGTMVPCPVEVTAPAMYGVIGNHFVSIDPATAAVTEIGTTAEDSLLQAMTYDSVAGSLLAIADAASEPRLIRIDPATGLATSIGLIDLYDSGGNLVTDIHFAEALAFNEADGRLYASVGTGVTEAGDVGTFSEILARIDPATGRGTKVAPFKLSSSPFPLGSSEADAMAFIGGTLYVSNTEPPRTFLFAVDPSTAAGASVGEVGFNHVADLAYDAATGVLLGTAHTVWKLIRIAPDTGAGTVIGTTHTPSQFDGATLTAIAVIPATFACGVPLDEDGNGTFASPTPGFFEAVGTVVDPFGNSASASTTFQVVDESQGADLVAHSMSVGGAVADPQTLVLSGTVAVSFENAGSMHVAPGFEVAVFEDLNLDGTFTADQDHLFGAVAMEEAVLAGESTRVEVPVFGQLRFRENVLLAMVDARQIVPETDETNNVVRDLVECDRGEGEDACVPAPQGLVSWWPGDGDATDIVDNNHGTLQNGATFAAGKVGPAFSFSGNDDWVRLGPAAMNGLTNFTVEYWMRSSDKTKSGTAIHATSSGNNEFIAFNYQSLGIYVKDTSWGSGVSLTDGAWHHVAVTRNGATGVVSLYVDAAFRGSAGLASGPLAVSCLVLGQEQDAVCGGFDPSQAFLGALDEVGIYNRTLSASEVQVIYGAGCGGKCGKPLTLATLSLPDAEIGRPYSETLVALGGTPPYAWSIVSGSLPPGLSLGGSSGVIRGSPTTEGTFAFTVQLSDSEGRTTTKELAIQCGACTEPPSGLVSWWPGDQSGEDIVGSNHGTLRNGAVLTMGKVGNAFGFDGTDDFVDIADAGNLSPHVGATGEVTIEAWVKISQLPQFDPGTNQGRRAVVAKGSPSAWEYALNISTTGSVQFSVWNLSGAGYAEPSGGVMTLNEWHHLAGTMKKGQFVRVYLDAVLVAESTSFAGNTADGSSPLFIGRRGDGQFFNGTVDEVTIYSRALSGEEIQALFTASFAGKCKPFTTSEPIRSRTYTVDADFDEGILVGVNHNAPNHDQLQLNKGGIRFPFIYVAASGKGTVVKISTETGAVLGEYLSAPDRRGRDPSRTTVDINGNAWVANRAEFDGGRGSVVRIGLLENHQCVDRNRNGVIDTSTGLGDVRPWPNPSGVDSNGGVSSAADECIINYTRVTGTGTRTVAVDANNDVWVGGWGNHAHEKLSGVTGLPISGTQFNIGCGGYGGVIDGNGVLWSQTGLRFVPNATPPPAGSGRCLSGVGNYGVAIDPATGHIWQTWGYWYYSGVTEADSDGNLLHTYQHGAGNAQGVVVDGSGNVWVAHSLNGSTVGHLRTDGIFVGNVSVGSGPTGVAVDTNGKVWVTNYNSWNVMRIDPNAGPIGGGGYRVGAVDLTVYLGFNAYPYNYSDMTGGVLFGAVVGRGSWTVIHDSKVAGTNWGSVSWTSQEPSGSSVTARARSADSTSGLSTGAYVDAPNGADIDVPDGRYLQVELTLKINQAGESPIVYDVTIRAGCEQDLTASRLATDQSGCPGQVSLSAVVGNGGAVPIPASTPVAFYDGDPVQGGILIGVTRTNQELLAGDSETVSVEWILPAPGGHTIFVVADDNGTGARSLSQESLLENNVAVMVRNICAPDPPPPTVFLVAEPVQLTGELVLVGLEVPAGDGAGEVFIVFTVTNVTDPDVPPMEVTLQDRGDLEVPLVFDTAGEYVITAEATDELGRTDTATATIEVEAADPTDRILPEVILLYLDPGPFIVGEPKRIDFVAVDNDAVAFTTIVEDSGTFVFDGGGPFSLSVSPDAAGDYRIVFTAEDRSGNRGSWVLTAIAFDPEAPPGPGPLPPLLTVQIDPNTIFPGESSAIRVDATDPQGESVTVTVDVGGERVPIINGVALYRSDPGFYGEFPVLVTATNQSGLRSEVRGILHILNPGDNRAPTVALSVDPDSATVGEYITFQVFGADDSGPPQLSLTVGGVDVPLDPNGIGRYTSSTPGVFDVVATATDSGGRRATIETTVEFVPRDDGVLPVGDLGSLAYDTLVSEPVDIVGTATDAHLAQWFLQYARQGDAGFTTFASGTEPVRDGLLGTLDPTNLINDRYTVQLVVVDEGGRVTLSSTEVTVRSDVKVGNFTLTFSDMTVDAAGLPVTVERTYDSRDKQMGDFGVGWTLSIADFDLREDEARNVTLTMPDGRRVTFYFDLANCGYFFVYVCAIWRAEPGVYATLTMAGDNRVLFDSLNGILVYFVDNPDVPFDCYQTRGYTLTLKDGTRYVLEKPVLSPGELIESPCGLILDDVLGDARLTLVVDRNGNSLTFTHDGILHSAGKSLIFDRDAEDRITVITDPNGEQIRYRYDAEGDLVGVTDQVGNETTFEYGPNHLLVAIRDPLGRVGIRNEYDDTGRLIAHVDAEGNRIEYQHFLDTRQEVVRDRLGNLTVYEYDARGDVVAMTDVLGGRTEYAYDANRNEILMRDPLGHETTRVYDPQGNLLFETDAMGNRTSWTYNARGQALTRMDALGHVTTNEYDANGNFLREVDALGNVTLHEYDAMGNLVQTVDAMGNSTLYEYDAVGYMTSTTDGLGNVTAYTYDANGNRLTEERTRTLPDGATETLVMRFDYDGAGRLVATTNPDGSVRRTEYDELGRQSAAIDELGRRTESRYDTRGYLGTTIYPDGTRETSTYDVEGRQVSRTDRGGRTTLMVYDDLGRLVRKTAPDGASTSATYDVEGNILAQTDARGNVTTFAYDAQDRQISVTDALGNTTRSEYDADGNLTATVDALVRRTTNEYDARNQRVRTVFPDATFTTTDYDPVGRRTAETDPSAKTTQFGYDDVGRLIRVTDALLQSWSYAYDEVGNMVLQTDANGNTTRIEYDRTGRQTARVLPLGQRETRSYDALGNLVSKTDFNGRTITYAYDVNDRLALRQYQDGTANAFSYTATGQRASVIDASGVTSYTYDLRDRLLAVTHPDGETLSYTYDPAGNLLSISTPSGTIAYTYDALDRLESVTDSEGRVTTYTYDPIGNRSGMSHPNDTRTRYTYDLLNRLTFIRHERSDGTVLASYEYTLGPAGNRIRVAEYAGRTVHYTYDGVYRLVEETIVESNAAVARTTYTYDVVGNRLTKTDGSGTASYVYDANERLLTAGGLTFSFDNNGNTVSMVNGGQTTAYTYDDENRLTHVMSPQGTLTNYAYDVDGLRVQKTNDSETTNFLVDMNNRTGLGQVLRETDGTGVEIVRYTYGVNLLSQTRGGISTIYHRDGQSSARFLTDGTGSETDSYSYDAFGNLLTSTGLTPNRYRYVGEQFDPETDSYYLRARYYAPVSGRFLTPDPVKGGVSEPRSLLRYAYALGDPVNNLDPTGRFALGALAEIIWILRFRHPEVESTTVEIRHDILCRVNPAGDASTDNFSLNEFRSHDRVEVPIRYRGNLQILMNNLEVLRRELGGNEIQITSGYRSVLHNWLVGGRPQSRHLCAQAADLNVEGYPPEVVYATIDRLIREGRMAEGGLILYPGTWVHYDVRGFPFRDMDGRG